ncbi:MAG: tRNA lysidine(34) synthetase TilS [Acidiferrobacterales bacterium]
MTNPENRFSATSLGQVLFGDLALAPDTSFKIAYSGGLDSHSLLHALAALRVAAPLRLEAVHVDHGMQRISADWSRHCVQVCARLEVPCQVERLEVRPARGEGLEAAAREARYAALMRHVAGADVLVTGHQQDDQAETVLLQLLRGTGVRGLAGMRPLGPFGNGRIARPLLGFSRAALHAYALAQGLNWIEDVSNEDTRYSRNRLRQQLIPQLEACWPQARAVLARNARHAAETAELVDEIAQEDLVRCVSSRGEGPGVIGRRLFPAPLSIPALAALTRPRRRNVLRYWLRMRGFLAPSAVHLEEIEAQLTHLPRSRQARIAWPQAEVRRYRDELYVMAPLTAVARDFVVDWDLAAPLAIPGTGHCLRPLETVGRGLARARLGRGTVRVCLRRGGETCQLPGRVHHQKLKKLLQARGLEPWLRERVPLVYVDEELAAVADLWVCEPYAARAQEPGVDLVWEPC